MFFIWSQKYPKAVPNSAHMFMFKYIFLLFGKVKSYVNVKNLKMEAAPSFFIEQMLEHKCFVGSATHYVTGQTWSYFAKSPHEDDGELCKKMA